jgi:hypothetical protein
MTNRSELFFFVCSVSDDLYGVSPNLDGTPLPTPGGGSWIPADGIDTLGDAKKGFVESEARKEINKWGCHWFTSEGSSDIYWGDEVELDDRQ